MNRRKVMPIIFLLVACMIVPMPLNSRPVSYAQSSIQESPASETPTAGSDADRSVEATELQNIGLAHYTAGRYARARDAFRQALAIRRQLGDRAGEGATLNSLGNTQDALGEFAQALDSYRQALGIRRELHDRAGEGATLNNIGNIHNNLGQYDRALDYYEQSLTIRQEVQDRAGEGATLTNIGNVYNKLGSYPKALDYYQRALTIMREVGDRTKEGIVLANIGTIRDTRGQTMLAIDSYRRALTIAQAAGDPPSEAAALSNIGDVYDTEGQYELALDFYRQSLVIWRTVGDRANQARLLENIGSAHESSNDYTAAAESYAQAISTVESIRAGSLVEELKTSWSAEQAALYERAMRLHLRFDRPVEAFDLTERARARTLLDQLGNTHLDAQASGNTQLVEQEQALRAELSRLEQSLVRERSKLVSQQDQDLLRNLDEQRTAAQREYEDVLTQLKLTNPEYASIRSIEPLSLAQVQQLLTPDTTLISYFVTAEQTLAFVVTRDSFTAVELPVKEVQLQAALGEFREFSVLSGDAPALAQLNEWLVAPLQAYLHTPRLAIVPFGILHYVPFAALGDVAHSLGEEHALYELPSASVLPFIQAKHKTGIGAALVMAYSDPAGVPPLPTADREAEAIAGLYGTQPILGSAATAGLFADRSRSASLVHLAVHGELNPGAPLFSRLLLAPDADSSGSLDVQSVYGLDLRQARLVTLSACQTQLGEQSQGDDIVGLSRAFLYAGTPSVVASLWRVDDAASTELMTAFYTELRAGRGKAEALQAAQAATRARYPHPYYWAGFVLTGDPDPVQVNENPGAPLAGGLGLSVTLLVLGLGFYVVRRWTGRAKDHARSARWFWLPMLAVCFFIVGLTSVTLSIVQLPMPPAALPRIVPSTPSSSTTALPVRAAPATSVTSTPLPTPSPALPATTVTAAPSRSTPGAVSGSKHFDGPQGVAVDDQGNIYVADTSNNRIQKLGSDGRVLAEWGGRGTGPGQFIRPTGVAVDRQRNIYVADTSNHRIQKLGPDGLLLAQWGSNGSGPGQFLYPSGVAVDTKGVIYVADRNNHSIQKLSPQGEPLARWGTMGSGPGQFSYPWGVAVDGQGNVYVADKDNDRVQKLSSDGELLATWGTEGHAPGQFALPAGVAVDWAGNIYVTDASKAGGGPSNHRIQKLSPEGEPIAQWGTSGLFKDPMGVAVDAAGNVFVADYGHNRVDKLGPDGQLLATWTGASAEQVQLQSPRGVAVDAHGNVYVTDWQADRLLMLDPDGRLLAEWGGGMDSSPGQFVGPSGVAVDDHGNIYVADQGNDRIQKLSPDGAAVVWGSAGAAPGQFSLPTGVAVDAHGYVYVADRNNQRIQKLAPDGLPLAQWGSEGSDPGQFNLPSAVAVDVQGYVYVADRDNHRIQKLSPDGLPLAEWGTKGSDPGQFDSPDGLAVDGSGNVYVADTRNCRVQKLSPEGEPIAQWGTRGTSPGELMIPEGVALGAQGTIYVADFGTGRIQKFSTAGSS